MSAGDAAITVQPIPTLAVMPLRCALLRPGLPPETAQFEGDDEAGTVHLGAYRADKAEPVGVVTLVTRPFADQPERPAFQLRGMAVAAELQGHGVGRQLVEQCFAVARERGKKVIWCNARTPASGFYRILGFEIIGPEFEIPTAGPHYRMWRAL